MSDHLCERKAAIHEVGMKLLRETHRTPDFMFALDELQCPNRRNCDPAAPGPCAAMKDGMTRLRLSQIEDEVFAKGFVRIAAGDLSDYERRKK